MRLKRYKVGNYINPGNEDFFYRFKKPRRNVIEVQCQIKSFGFIRKILAKNNNKRLKSSREFFFHV